jgi:hypothetical protein
MDAWDVLIADCDGVARLVDPDGKPVVRSDPSRTGYIVIASPTVPSGRFVGGPACSGSGSEGRLEQLPIIGGS